MGRCYFFSAKYSSLLMWVVIAAVRYWWIFGSVVSIKRSAIPVSRNMIGTLGRKIIFEVSDNRVLTFESMSREVSGRWTEHEVLGVKPKAEFLGPGLQTISLTIHLSAALGVKPRRILDMVERMVERGTAEYLVIGGRLVGRRPFRVTGSSEAWDKVYSRGELAKATLTISLEEYA